jgi:DNA-binding PadR family transcriptional regulator
VEWGAHVVSVRSGILALLAEGASFGAQLKADFEARTGSTWPLNVGQVYTTLGRLERDGLVEQAGGPDDEGRIPYQLTATGRAEVARWWSTPVDRDSTPRDELVIKLALAVTAPGVDVPRVVQTQRTATLKHLRDLTRLKQRAVESAGQVYEHSGDQADDHADGRGDLAWLLVLENLIFAAEGEARWLDHVEARLAREATMRRTPPPGIPDHPGAGDTAHSTGAHREVRSWGR